MEEFQKIEKVEKKLVAAFVKWKDKHSHFPHCSRKSARFMVWTHRHPEMEKYRHPDFQMVLNFPQEYICYLLNTIVMRVQGVETFHDGEMVSGIYEDYSIRLKKVRETGRDVLRLKL